MNRNILKKYAPEARRDFIRAVTDRASYYGLTKKKTEPVTVEGDVAIINGRPFPKKVAEQRKKLEEKIGRLGFDQVMEAVAYTWFNRLVAIRYMELHGYLDHGYRVLSHPEGDVTPEIVEHAEHLDLPGLDKQKVISLKLDGTKESELYRMLLIAQCNALHKAMPFLFEHIGDETELLLPDNLLHSDSLIRTLVKEIPEEDWQEVEIIGWLYQFYISEKKDQVIGKVVKSEDIPAATQLFTPNWIVKYLVQNSLGRQWMATYPNSPLKDQMEYYIEPAEQTPEVQEQLKAITPESLNPEELTLLDPACGSGHILVEAYDLLKAIYQERGYRAKDIPRLILEKNLFGLEIDDRAAQLAAFALMMKARADSHRIFDDPVQSHVLAIQESDGLDAREITEALNAPLGGNRPERSVSVEDISTLIDLFEQGKTFGSLVRVPKEVAHNLNIIAQRVEAVANHGSMFEKAGARAIKPLVEQARVLALRHNAIAANPPYMGNMFPALKKLAKEGYPDSKADLFAMFIERGFELCRQHAYLAMVTMQSWMFLKAFQTMREALLSRKVIVSMAHLGPRAFSEIAGEVVQTTAFACCNSRIADFRPSFFRLVDGDDHAKDLGLRQRQYRFDISLQSAFGKFPGTPLAYWLSDKARAVFERMPSLETLIEPQVGLQTSNTDRFIRMWHEVAVTRISFDSESNEDAKSSERKWFPLDKGGSFRRWYGNNEFVVNWERNGQEIKQYVAERYPYLKGNTDYVVKDRGYFFKPGVTWNKISSGVFAARVSFAGAIFSDAGMKLPCSTYDQVFGFAGLLNSCVAHYYLTAMSPTLNVEKGAVSRLPVAEPDELPVEQAKKCVQIAKTDWDSFEESWDFSCHPFVSSDGQLRTISSIALQWDSECEERISLLHEYETANNIRFVRLYGLEGEVNPDVRREDITLYHPDRQEDIRRLVSYTIGCMMGRYSPDTPGLIYARSGSEGFDASQYQTFPADADGIIPITDFEWFDDDAANRLEDFIATAWPKEHLEENLKFVADSLGPNKGERPRETIRRYLTTGFYKHHLQLYKKRPIYWLFSSGKQRAFQCLVYLHRYNEGTLSRMRTEYVIPLSGQMASRIDQLEGDIAAATSTSHRKKLEKERQTLIKQREELQAFDEQLRHYADQRIKLDLDDGVKVNYGKFGDLLADVKAITGGKSDD